MSEAEKQSVQTKPVANPRSDSGNGPTTQFKRELAGLGYDQQRARVRPTPAAQVQLKGDWEPPIVQFLPDPQKSAYITNDLPALGISSTIIDTLRAGMSDADIETFAKAVGGARFKELVVTKALPPAALVQHGAPMLKTFIGAGTNTVNHIATLDGISGGEIKGCHDEDLFRGTINTDNTYAVFVFDSGGQVMEPVPQTDLEAYQKSLKKYQGVFAFYHSDRNKTKGGGKKLKTEPTAPDVPQPKPKKDTVTLRQSQITNEIDLMTTGVKNLTYDLRKNTDGQFRVNASKMKTTIKNLSSAPDSWTTLANEAIWSAIAGGTFGQNWSGVCSSGATIDGYYNGGNEVDTFFFTS